MEYKYRRRNPKKIALIIEIILLVGGGITALVLDGAGIYLNWIPVVIYFAVVSFALVLTLSLIRYDAMRDIRADGSFKGTNLPLFTDPTTLMGHDIKEESHHKEKDE